jgi:Mg-chelatase subunit ChlD
MRFTWPWALVLLALVPWVWRRATPGGRGFAALRAVSLCLAALALAGLQLADRGAPVQVVFAVDRSDSVLPEQARWAERFVQEALRYRRPADRVGLVTFGGEAVAERAPSETAELRPTQRPAPYHTDLGAAIRLSASLLDGEGVRRVVVLTDGGDHGGDAVQAAREARAAGVEVHAVLLPRTDLPEVVVEEVGAPPVASAGERVPVWVAVRSTVPQPVELELWADGAVVQRRTVHARAGRTVVPFSVVARQPGWLDVRVQASARQDGVVENNVGWAVVVVGGPPQVLYAGRGRVAELLQAQGFSVRSVLAHRLPGSAADLARYDAVVLEDLSALELSRPQMEALRDYVRDLGGGLVVVGGPHAFGVGGYGRTPLEEVLPVSMEVQHRVALPSMALVLVLDTSGSMGAVGTEPAKVELAKEVARSVVELLGDRDLIGILQFDQSYRWLVPLVPARDREGIVAQVARLTAGGGTDLLPALRAAYEGLRGVSAQVKHVIVLSDGQTDPGDFERWVRRMRAEGITLSTVSVGKDADVAFMSGLSRWGGGRHYLARDTQALPQIFVTEALLSSRSYLVEERFVPQRHPGEVLAGIGPVPALRGYVATSSKPAAQTELSSPHRDPILASWRYGLGRAVAFTSDAVPRWSVEWQSWPGFARFWSQVVRWAARLDSGALDARADLHGARLRLRVDARDQAGGYLDGLRVRASVAGPTSAQHLALRQTGPGWYEAEAVLQAPGLYTVTVTAQDGARVVGRSRLPVAVPYPPELQDPRADPTLLSRVAEAGGGRVLRAPEEVFRPPAEARHHRDAWPALVACSLTLFLVELVARRVPVLAGWLAAAAQRRRASTPADEWYAEADRWRPLAGPPPDPETERRARLYVARLGRHGP